MSSTLIIIAENLYSQIRIVHILYAPPQYPHWSIGTIIPSESQSSLALGAGSAAQLRAVKA